jgi:hypothetical protein
VPATTETINRQIKKPRSASDRAGQGTAEVKDRSKPDRVRERSVKQSTTVGRSRVGRSTKTVQPAVKSARGTAKAGKTPQSRGRERGNGPRRTWSTLPISLESTVTGFLEKARLLGLAAAVDKLKDPVAFGAELAQLAVTRATLETAVGGYVGVTEAAKVLGVNSRQAVHQRIARGTLLAMDTAGQTVIPTFQFDDDRVRPEIARAAKLLAPAGLSDAGVVSWFTTPQPELGGIAPADWLAAGSDVARVYEAARHTAGALAH